MLHKIVRLNGASLGAPLGEDAAADGREAVERGGSDEGPALPAGDIWQ